MILLLRQPEEIVVSTRTIVELLEEPCMSAKTIFERCWTIVELLKLAAKTWSSFSGNLKLLIIDKDGLTDTLIDNSYSLKFSYSLKNSRAR
jgi:hypothetical protein